MSGIIEHNVPFVEIACRTCKHYLREEEGLICQAFLDGIPDEILLGDNDHRKPLPGQPNDIVYEPEE